MPSTPPTPHLIIPGAAVGRRRFLRLGVAGLTAVGISPLVAACGSDGEADPAASADTSAADPSTAATAGSSAPAATASVETRSISAAMGWIKNVEYAGSWLAISDGDYEAAGIDPTYLAGGPNAPQPPVSVAAGDAQIGISANMQSLLDAMGAGNDFVVFATQYQASPGAVLSLAERPVRTPEDLVGTTFLGQEGVNEQIDSVLQIAGLERDYEFVVAGFTPDPLLEGQGDAYSCFAVNQPITLEQQGLVEGEDFFVTPWADLGLPSYANLFFAERSYLEAERDAIVRFMRATITGWERNALDPEVGARLAVEEFGSDLGLDIDQQVRQNELQIPFMLSDLTESSGLMRLDAERWDGPMADAYVASGRESMPAAADVIDLTLLDEVYGESTSLLDG
ncbi:ABC transporter substrate-binding protein [Ilumatobacter sp.]|uniref:ABC transporter substrate-binding protein n=1 Tax=Ilumatobacter sp. TaxID=1967498 RepID=UPI003B529B1E